MADLVEALGDMGEACHADLESRLGGGRLCHIVVQFCHLCEDNFTVVQVVLALGGEPGAAARALKQREAALLFGNLQNMTQLRLRDEHCLCGMVDGAVLCNGDNVFDVICVQACLLLVFLVTLYNIRPKNRMPNS